MITVKKELNNYDAKLNKITKNLVKNGVPYYLAIGQAVEKMKKNEISY